MIGTIRYSPSKHYARSTCATVDIGNCRLSNRKSFSSVIHPAKDQSQCQTLPDSSVSRLHICVERTIAFSLGDGMFDIQSLLHTACEVFMAPAQDDTHIEV